MFRSSRSSFLLLLAPPFLRSEPVLLEHHKSWDATPGPFMRCHYHKDVYPPGQKDSLVSGKNNNNVGLDPKYKEGRKMGWDFHKKDGFSYYMAGKEDGSNAPGFDAHPHRGLSTLSITLDKMTTYVDHFDSTGGAARYGGKGGGDCHWMVAGGRNNSGCGDDENESRNSVVLHSDMLPCVDTENNNVVEMLNLWIKLENSTASKTGQFYQMLWKEDIPIAKIPVSNNSSDNDEEHAPNLFSKVRCIVGDYPYNLPFKPPSPPSCDFASKKESQCAVYICQLPCDGASIKLPPMLTSTAERTVYFYDAEDEVNSKMAISPVDNEEEGTVVDFNHGVRIQPDVEAVITNVNNTHNKKSNIGVLVLAGEPLNEPTVIKGPFIAESKEAIEATYANFRKTQFGNKWPWPRKDMTWPRDTPRQSVPREGADIEYPPKKDRNKEMN